MRRLLASLLTLPLLALTSCNDSPSVPPAAPAKPPRPVISSTTISPATVSQTISSGKDLRIIVPAGCIDKPRAVTISAPLPERVQPLPGLHRVAGFEIDIQDLHDFRTPLTVEIALDPARFPEGSVKDGPLVAIGWDSSGGFAEVVPVTIDRARNTATLRVSHLSEWDLYCQKRGYLTVSQGDSILQNWPGMLENFVLSYHPSSTAAVGRTMYGDYKHLGTGKSGAVYKELSEFFKLVGAQLEAVHNAYTTADARFNFKQGIENEKQWVFMVNREDWLVFTQHFDSPEWSAAWGTITIPLNNDSEESLKIELAHELFHRIQNRTMNPRGMHARRWWTEACATWASERIACGRTRLAGKIHHTYTYAIQRTIGKPGTGNGEWFTRPLTTVDSVHEYAAAHFVDYLITHESAVFAEMYQAVVSSYSGSWMATGDVRGLTIDVLDKYLKGKHKDRGFAEAYRSFTQWLIFNDASPLVETDGYKPMGSFLRSHLNDGKVDDSTLRENDKEIVWKPTLPANGTARLRALGVEVPNGRFSLDVSLETGDLPEGVVFDVFVLPDNKRQQLKPAASFTGKGRKLGPFPVGPKDVLYVLATNPTANEVCPQITFRPEKQLPMVGIWEGKPFGTNDILTLNITSPVWPEHPRHLPLRT